MPISESVERWWPLPDSLDLVRASTDVVASAVFAEVTRYAQGEPLSSAWVPFESMNGVFESVSVFTNVPTVVFVLPTHSDWTVLWNNSYLCDGWDSLCFNLASNYALTTMDWRSSDNDAVFQAGSSFTFRKKFDSGLIQRSVYCGKNDERWEFEASGEPLPEEDIAAYSNRRTRDRLDERGMLALLARLGARPWEDDFYRPGKAFRIERVSFPVTISQKEFSSFACKKTNIHD